MSVGKWSPVVHQGQLFVLDEPTSVWVPFERADLVRTVAELHDGKQNCKRAIEYTGIADHALSVANDGSFFEEAPTGIACAGSFYSVSGDSIEECPLTPDHRQRVMLGFKPTSAGAPLFQNFLRETFSSETLGDEEQQVRLVQEIAGAVLLGVMPRYHKAVLFYDPYGRAGKGTLERVISELVPDVFTTAVSPFVWGMEYHMASLAGSRLNVVGELPDDRPIPAADFKSVIGGDRLSGRQPTKSVITFRNEAAHIFTSNHLIPTRDQSEAFFSRWLLVHFPNSLLRSGRPVEAGLSGRIVSQEMPAIAYWALEGGARLLSKGAFSPSAAHDRLLKKWRQSSNSVDEFIYECCELSTDKLERRSALYSYYRAWCQDNGRKPYSKSKVKELMEYRVGLPVRFSILDGIEVIRGLQVRDDFKDQHTFI